MADIRYISSRVVADKAGFEFFAEFYNGILGSQETDVYVNFDQCKEFDANLAAVLGAILDCMTENGRRMYVSNPKERGVRRALSRNKFLKAFDVQTRNEDRENFIVYRKFGTDEPLAFKSFINSDLIRKQRFPHCTPKAAEKIIESIYEIFANAASHGKCRYIYCCGEVHSRGGKSMMDMTFVNLGTTVVENVNTYLQTRYGKQLGACETLRWAFVKGNTTKPIPGGLGLDILKEFIGMNEGTIQMVSGNAMLEIENNTVTGTLLDRFFPGTIVNVEFNCSDQKAYLLPDEQIDLNNLL